MMGPTVNTLKIKIKKKKKKKTEICVTQSAAAEYSPLKILKIQNEGGGGWGGDRTKSLTTQQGLIRWAQSEILYFHAAV